MKHVRQLVVDSVVADKINTTFQAHRPEVALGRIRVTATDGDTEVSFHSRSFLKWNVGDRVYITVGHEQPAVPS